MAIGRGREPCSQEGIEEDPRLEKEEAKTSPDSKRLGYPETPGLHSPFPPFFSLLLISPFFLIACSFQFSFLASCLSFLFPSFLRKREGSPFLSLLLSALSFL